MRVSECYALGASQADLDFVNVALFADSPLYLDPLAIRGEHAAWYRDCVDLLQNYFAAVLAAVSNGQQMKGLLLLAALREPNDTRLGVSQGHVRGHGVGPGSARAVWHQLSESEAAKSGLLKDLEDTALLVPGIGSDIISDMVTNVIRDQLIRYTQEQCNVLGIPMTPGSSGRLWDPANERWVFRDDERLPRPRGRRLLLVPKRIVRFTSIAYNASEYCTHYILPELQEQQLAAGTALVHTLKNGNQVVHKKELRKKFGGGKPLNNTVTLHSPRTLEQYRQDKCTHPTPPLTDGGLDQIIDGD